MTLVKFHLNLQLNPLKIITLIDLHFKSDLDELLDGSFDINLDSIIQHICWTRYMDDIIHGKQKQ